MIKNIFKFLLIFTLFFLLAACATHYKTTPLSDSNTAPAFSFAQPSTSNLQGGEDQVYYIPEYSIYIQSKDIPSITAQAKYLLAHPQITVLIIGNTDNIGSLEYTFALGWQYAQAVANMLLQQGVLPNQINVVSYGKEKPTDLWHNEGARSLNRRVILHYYGNS